MYPRASQTQFTVTLFTVSINDISSVLPADVKCTFYVDDFSIFFVLLNMRIVEHRLQLRIGRVESWAD